MLLLRSHLHSSGLGDVPRLQIEGDVAYGRLHFQWVGLFNPSARYSGQRQAAAYYDVTYRREQSVWRMQHRLEKAITGQTSEHFDVYVDANFGHTNRSVPVTPMTASSVAAA